uniref:Uncharacterized protein n=1 Tax=Cacopsylla melanoneura TaxID=428564 RepID=A0A8D8ZWQ7_9HEMI
MIPSLCRTTFESPYSAGGLGFGRPPPPWGWQERVNWSIQMSNRTQDDIDVNIVDLSDGKCRITTKQNSNKIYYTLLNRLYNILLCTVVVLKSGSKLYECQEIWF